MQGFWAKKQLFLVYGFFVCWAIMAFSLRFLIHPSAFSLTLILLWLLSAPGFVLGRIFRFKIENRFDRLILALTLGFIFNFLIFFVSELIGLNLLGLMIFFFAALTITFIFSFVRECQKKDFEPIKLEIKNLWKIENLFVVLTIMLALGLLAILSQVGGNFLGDPLFHMALMRKIIDGQSLAFQNLNFVKYSVNYLYAFPLWHMFLVFIAKLAGISIFTLWQEIQTPLTLLALVIWYWVLRQILPTKYLALLALNFLILFIISRFVLGGKVYLFRRLAIPDTAAQLMFLPLSIGLAIRYIFDKATDWKWWIVTILLVFFAGVIHLVQYIYFMAVLGGFGLIYIIVSFKDEDSKEKIKRIGQLFFGSLIVILPYLIILQSIGHVVSRTAKDFWDYHRNEPLKYGTFQLMRLYTKFAYVFMPLLLIFARRQKKFLLIPIMFAIVMLVYFTNIRFFLIKAVSHTVVQRLYTNMEWSFVVWATILGFILMLTDRLVARFSTKIRIAIDSVLAIAIVGLLFLATRAKIYPAYKDIFTSFEIWLNSNYIYFMIIALIIAIAVIIMQKYSKKWQDFFEFAEFKKPLTVLLLTLIFILIISSPSQYLLFTKTKAEIQNQDFFQNPTDPMAKIIDMEKVGGQETIEYIRRNIPPKSVFDSNSGFELLPMLTDQFMSNYWSLAAFEYSKVYQKSVPVQEKLGCLNLARIDYLLVVKPPTSDMYFEQFPQYFTKIFQNDQARIYQINKSAIKDFPAPEAIPDKHVCRFKTPK